MVDCGNELKKIFMLIKSGIMIGSLYFKSQLSINNQKRFGLFFFFKGISAVKGEGGTQHLAVNFVML